MPITNMGHLPPKQFCQAFFRYEAENQAVQAIAATTAFFF